MIELLTIGDELLLGTTVDTNAAYLGERLTAAGYRVLRHTSVGDGAEAIRSALRDALQRTGCVICTGGLGPTPDDLTRPVVAECYGWELRLNEEWLVRMEERFRGRGMAMPEINRQQAMVPAGATVFPNRRGTAPGLALHDAGLGTTILLPGVPSELRALLDEQVLPYLARVLGPGRPIRSRTVRTTGMAESVLAERLAGLLDDQPHLTLAYLPTGMGIDLRLTSWGELDATEAERALAEAEGRLRRVAGGIIYGTGRQDLAAVVGASLAAAGLTLAVAESCTGGMLGSRITSVPGSSDYFLGGVIAYADATKEALLDVSPRTLALHGAVSEQAALELARGVARVTGADCGLAITGIAGPGGASAEKPVGTVWLALDLRGSTRTELQRFPGTREEVRARSAQAALALLRRTLEEGDHGE